MFDIPLRFGKDQGVKVLKKGETRWQGCQGLWYQDRHCISFEANNGSWVQRYFIHGLGLLGMVEGNNLYTYHFDATGNTLAMTNASQNYVNRYAYSAYGKIAAQNETIPQPFKYVGQFGVQYEADHNLYYMRARYYDPEIGRFISEDPIGFGGGQVNLYAYVAGNPISGIDPTGLVDWKGVGFGVIDFTLSTGEAAGGVGFMISSPVLGPGAPVGFTGGAIMAGHGGLGMLNSGLAIQNALYDTSAPGFLEYASGAIFGDSGATVGAAGDLFLGLRPAAIASGGMNKLSDLYDLASGINTMDDAFSTRFGSCQ